jgi:hypothetical protein
VPRTHQEIVRALATQRHHMAASSTAYDAGDKSEALRLATIMCNIVHDAGRTRSILSLLGLKTKIVFMASGHEITEEIRRIADRFTPLTELERYPKGGRDPEFVPVSTFFKNRGMHPFLRELPFEEWWQKNVISREATSRGANSRESDLYSRYAIKKAGVTSIAKCATAIIYLFAIQSHLSFPELAAVTCMI